MKKVCVIIVGIIVLLVSILIFALCIPSKSDEEKWQERHYLLSDSEYLGTHQYKKHNANSDLIIEDENITEMVLTLLSDSHEGRNIPIQYDENIAQDVYASLSPIPPKINTPISSTCNFSILSINYTNKKMVVNYCYSYVVYSLENNEVIHRYESSSDAPPKLYLEKTNGQWIIIKKTELF